MDFTNLKTNLEQLDYQVSCFDTGAEAADYLNSQIDQKTVGFGGSVTLEQIGLYDKLHGHNIVNWHWKIPEGKTASDVRSEANASDIYISSVNGMAETGEIINIDGICNRVAAILYGHEKVFLVVGENKIASDYEHALERARNIAAPQNAKRMNMKTPCAKDGNKCYNCKSPDRICRALSVLWKKPLGGDFEIILIHEKLGF